MNEAGLGARVWTELQRSLGETFGVFRADERALDFPALLTQAVVALIILGVFAMLYALLSWVSRTLSARLRLPAELVGPVLLALRYLLTLIAVLVILAQFGMPPALLNSVAVAAVLTFAFLVLWLAASRLLVRAMRLSGVERSLEQLVRNVLAVFIVVFGLVTVLGQFGIELLSVITTLGVVGIAVGFAAQDTLANFIAGVTLLIERPFRLGDWIEVEGQVGRIEEITLRTTHIITRDNAMIVIPNAKIASSDIVNLSAGGPLRLRAPLGIAYKESAARARAVLMPVLEAHERVLKVAGRQPAVRVTALGDSSVELALIYWIAPQDIATQPAIAAELLEAAKDALDAAGIEIPFPHLQLFIDDARGLTPVLEPLLAGRERARSDE